jgi:hypothetical protein
MNEFVKKMHNKNLEMEKEVGFEVSSHRKWEREREKRRSKDH